MLDLSFHFGPEHLLSTHATEIFKTVASDPNATEDTKDPVEEGEEDEDDLDDVQDRLLSTEVVTEDSVADQEVTEDGDSNRN